MKLAGWVVINVSQKDEQLKVADLLSGMAADIRKGEMKGRTVCLFIPDERDADADSVYNTSGDFLFKPVYVWGREAGGVRDVCDMRVEGGASESDAGGAT